MKRTTVKIPDDLEMLLRSEATRRGTTISAITREALEEHFQLGKPRKLMAAGAGASGRTDISSRIDEILAAEWGNRAK